MHPSQPRLLLPIDIVTQVSLQPFVHYFSLPICLWVIAGAWYQLRPYQLKELHQKPPMKLLFRSLTIAFRRPCNLKTSLKNKSVNCAIVYRVDIENKCAYFVSRSTTTKMQSLPCTVGNPVTKSIEMLSHFPSGMGRGCNKPAGWFISPLFLWKTSHSWICRSMSSLRPFQIGRAHV